MFCLSSTMYVRDQPELDHCCGSVVYPASLPPSEGSDKSLESFTLSLAELIEDLNHHPYELSPLSLGNHPYSQVDHASAASNSKHSAVPLACVHRPSQIRPFISPSPQPHGVIYTPTTSTYLSIYFPPSLRLSSSEKYSNFLHLELLATLGPPLVPTGLTLITCNCVGLTCPHVCMSFLRAGIIIGISYFPFFL